MAIKTSKEDGEKILAGRRKPRRNGIDIRFILFVVAVAIVVIVAVAMIGGSGLPLLLPSPAP
ncbi:MAG: hypothetical protein UU77_C0070G0003 [candidate division WWE3 bacterium GW2011_GWC1_41_7]|uniref:Uncharacterized protein n=4 Tax=Katanobacteria TaxID=422282 RepID=A0A0G0X8E0_UNCKA|nr:MAG: hypothetical protein UU72_C0006G0002 [candidate division WWE3 bacterium GW2011_GWB1_41_6]KKS18698.1 MAG: hypothetical protein UU77_C0070G0003 [candidate division WWE3 bacterium GW2011_GWC1_41_7]KKS20657.1 MAG: hypothetical protein UU80_C0047G0003 [candidate division WWE3 bacterium GW2011_GWA1_41_8]OGC57095.1 MAG: hypothetical protein A2976_01870 [candidate division WWE3 bacterium RIFCSPLOWO2_01_FULL_41_9]